MTEADWTRIAAEVVIAMVSGFVSAVATAYRFGRRSAEERAALKDDLDARINDLRKETVGKMDQAIRSADARNELLVEQFKETLEGNRRQLDDHRLEVEKHFFRKEDFTSFMTAYREDQNRINDKLDKLLQR